MNRTQSYARVISITLSTMLFLLVYMTIPQGTVARIVWFGLWMIIGTIASLAWAVLTTDEVRTSQRHMQ